MRGGHTEVPALDARHRDSYAKEAEVYDRKRFASPSRAYYQSHSNAVYRELSGAGTGVRILDVATGTGRIALGLAESGATVFGTDLTEAMLRQALAKARNARGGRLHFGLANARALPFADDQFDVVVSVRFLHLFPPADQRAFIAEMWRVLKPGGRLILEYNNAYAGGVYRPLIDLITRLSGGPSGGRHRPSQTRALFEGYPPVARRGLWFPGMGWIAQWSPAAVRWLDRAGQTVPVCYLTEQVLFHLRKPHSAAATSVAR